MYGNGEKVRGRASRIFYRNPQRKKHEPHQPNSLTLFPGTMSTKEGQVASRKRRHIQVDGKSAGRLGRGGGKPMELTLEIRLDGPGDQRGRVDGESDQPTIRD